MRGDLPASADATIGPGLRPAPENCLFDLEVTDHPGREMNVTAKRVLARLQLDGPGFRAGEGHTRLLVHAWAEEMEVVTRALVANRDFVAAGLERFHDLAALGQGDRETGADLADQL